MGVTSDYIDNYTSGWDAVEQDVRDADWDELTRESGVTRPEIEKAAEMLIKAKHGIFCWAMGLTHHEHGVDNILALSNLALAPWMVGSDGLWVAAHPGSLQRAGCRLRRGISRSQAGLCVKDASLVRHRTDRIRRSRYVCLDEGRRCR